MNQSKTTVFLQTWIKESSSYAKVVVHDLLHQKNFFKLTFIHVSCNTLHTNIPTSKWFLQEDSVLLHLQAGETARNSCVSTWLS